MFLITFEDQTYKQWSHDTLFEDFKEAKKYLTDDGFVEDARLFIRKDYNWSKYVKAYITPVKVKKKQQTSQEIVDLFNKSSFKKEAASLYNLNSSKKVDMTPDEDGYFYVPESTTLSPTSLMMNGDDEDAHIDYAFIVKLINEFRNQQLEKE